MPKIADLILLAVAVLVLTYAQMYVLTEILSGGQTARAQVYAIRFHVFPYAFIGSLVVLALGVVLKKKS